MTTLSALSAQIQSALSARKTTKRISISDIACLLELDRVVVRKEILIMEAAGIVKLNSYISRRKMRLIHVTLQK